MEKIRKYLLASCRPEARYSTTTLQLSWLTWGSITLVTRFKQDAFRQFRKRRCDLIVLQHQGLQLSVFQSPHLPDNSNIYRRDKISVCDENECVLVLKSLFHFSCCMKLYRILITQRWHWCYWYKNRPLPQNDISPRSHRNGRLSPKSAGKAPPVMMIVDISMVVKPYISPMVKI